MLLIQILTNWLICHKSGIKIYHNLQLHELQQKRFTVLLSAGVEMTSMDWSMDFGKATTSTKSIVRKSLEVISKDCSKWSDRRSPTWAFRRHQKQAKFRRQKLQIVCQTKVQERLCHQELRRTRVQRIRRVRQVVHRLKVQKSFTLLHQQMFLPNKASERGLQAAHRHPFCPAPAANRLSLKQSGLKLLSCHHPLQIPFLPLPNKWILLPTISTR